PVSAEDPAALSQIVGVVLHERRSALETVTHDLHGPHKRRRFPVAFRAESISIGHQTLHGNSWKLRQAVQVLKRVSECLGAGVLKKIPQPSSILAASNKAGRRLPPARSGSATA